MISKIFNKLKSVKVLCIGAVCLLALVLLTAGIAWHVSGAVTGKNTPVNVYYVYSAPKGSTLFNPYYTSSQTVNTSVYEGELFPDRYVKWNANPGGSVTLIGPGYVKTFAGFMEQNGNYVRVKEGTLLDCETYYLDKPDSATQGLQWAYTFVGWHILGAEEYIPMETVFQMGDVIPAHVAQLYDLDKTDNEITLNFETLWARCFFVQDATDANGAATGAGVYDITTSAPYKATRYGNDPARPLSSISDAFKARNTTYVGDTVLNGSQLVGVASEIYDVTFNAYTHAIMLTGKTTFNRVSGQPPMYSNYARPHSVTFKSLQATRSNTGAIQRSDGLRHTLSMSMSGFAAAEFHIIASTRFDNIDFYQNSEIIFQIFDIYGTNNISSYADANKYKNNHYFETTARFTTRKASGVTNNLYIRAYECEKMVLNGGTLGSVYLGWSLPARYSTDVEHTWYFGRNISIQSAGSITIGLNSPTSDTNYSSNDRIIITGGNIPVLYGAGMAMGPTVTGNRNYILYGQQNNNGNIQSANSYEYNPNIKKFYGGGYNYKLTGDINVKGYGCSNLGEFYAGGFYYPAVVTGDITSTFEDCDFSGTVSGGGMYADTIGNEKGKVRLVLMEGSNAAKNVYGSGMGYVTTFTRTTSDKATKPDDWNTKPTGFPVAEKQADGSVWILTSKYKRCSTITGSDSLRYIEESLYSFVSTAKANSTEVIIDNSTVGENLYGGGDYASVIGNTSVIVRNNAVVNKTVHGGSDANRVMPALELYRPFDGEYVGPTTVSNNHNYGTKYEQAFTWTNDTALKDAGIDLENFRVYTNAEKGKVGGSTSVHILSNATVGNVFGGGNAGEVAYDTAIEIDNAKVTNNVFGGCYAADVGGNVNITVNAGSHIGWYIFGGNDEGGLIKGNITTVMNGGTVKEDIYGSSRSTKFDNTSSVTINGGTVENDIFGGGFEGDAGNTIVTINNGTVKGNLYGGGDNGDANSTNVTINGGNFTFEATVDANGNAYPAHGIFGGGRNGAVLGDAGTSLTITDGTLQHQVFGGGFGTKATATKTQVNIAGGTYYGAIFGGGYSGNVTGLAKVNVTSSGWVFPNDNNKIKDGRIYGLFGGGYMGSVGSTYVIFDNAGCSVLADTYGGGYEGAVAGLAKIEAKQYYGQYKALFGGGYGENATVGSVDIDIANIGTLESAAIYGGGNLGAVKGNVNVDILDITCSGHIFGGGNNAQVGGNVELNIAGYVSTSGNDSVDQIFGGGRNGKVVGNTTLTLLDCVTKASVCGGGYEGAVDGNTNVIIDATSQGATITSAIYGGGYRGVVGGNTTVLLRPNVRAGATVYGGGNEGNVNGSTTVDAYAYFIHNLIGGCTAANVGVDTNVTVYDGAHVDLHVYGGNQTSGDIGGKTTVTIKGGTVDGFVFGGGQNATTNAASYVNIEGGNVCVGTDKNEFGNVYGGGFQAGVGDTYVTIAGGTVGSNNWAASVYGGSHGGGSSVNSSNVVVENGTIKGNVYGGGYSGSVDQNTSVTVSGGIATNAFGGGNMGNVDGNTALNITGGKLASAFGGNDTSGVINGAIAVHVSGGTVDQVYGGGSKANVSKDATDSIAVNISAGTVTKVFGGGMLAYTEITPVVTVNGNSANITSLYGGGYQAATVGSDVRVNAGNIGTVYGGGYAGAVTNTKVLIDDHGSNSNVITINGNVYGGGEGITATVNNSTSVRINTDGTFTATEINIDSNEITPSGAVETQISNINFRSRILGSVYGGGDLGRVGEGIIYVGGESAHVGHAGTTNVLISNGYIGGNVFAGGRGIPTAGVYDVTMGVVFGSTNVTVNGGYIGFDNAQQGNVYGGGEQSRVYSDGQATNVDILEVSGKSIAIKGSVFGGGDRGEAGATNASVPTVIGKTDVKIAGYQADVPSRIYFLTGGVYGDGNLCLVKGESTITLENFKAEAGKLKTFYSLQRADTVVMNNSAVVLRGAIDKVAEDDEQVYSINRVGHLQMTNGSTVKLEQVVKYLSALSSDVHTDRHFIHLGNNGVNNYVYQNDHKCDGNCLEILTKDQITNYQNNVNGHNSNDKNVVSVANGLYLEIRDENGKYGPITGLFTLQLLYANPGEGGGFVYGSIPESTGDFICETKRWDFSKIAVDSATFNNNQSRTYYVRTPGNGYEIAPAAYDVAQNYYVASPTDTYMEIIDNVGGYQNSQYKHYYWYIGGSEVRYDLSITGYLGTGRTSDSASVNVPQHMENISYVLYGVNVNDELSDALYGATPAYVLANNADALTGNQIAVEIKLGSKSLGFLTKIGENWAIRTDDGNGNIQDIVGYRGTISDNVIRDNVLYSGNVVDKENDYITFVLHKAEGVNVETRNMAVYLDVDKFESVNGNFVNVTTDDSTMSFSTYISIIRLLPVQNMYHDNLRSYTGVGTTNAIRITGNSCFTVEYQTNYIPTAFAGGTFEWTLSGASAIPAGTKITMIDLSADIPSYYYYICDTATSSVNLLQFKQMGSELTIGSLPQQPAFYNAYTGQQMSIFNERLLFVFDFEGATLAGNTYTNTLTLHHLHNGVDIMDHMKDDGSDSDPKSVVFNIGVGETGLGTYTASFDSVEYADNGNAILNVNVSEHAEWINTWFREYGFAIEVQLNNADRMPSGMYISYMGQKYYPGADGKTISVPIYEFGSHQLEICNTHGGLTDVLTDSTNVAKYSVGFYCAPDAKYHMNLGIASTSASHTVTARLVSSLLVTPPANNGSIVNVGDFLRFDVSTEGNVQLFALFAETVDVELFRKVNGEYTAVDISSVFSEVGNVIRTGDQSWKVTGDESGTYRITFNYMNNTEHLNFIIP